MPDGRGTSLCERAEAHRCARGQRLIDVREGRGSSLSRWGKPRDEQRERESKGGITHRDLGS
jgi:hypothetical protein